MNLHNEIVRKLMYGARGDLRLVQLSESHREYGSLVYGDDVMLPNAVLARMPILCHGNWLLTRAGADFCLENLYGSFEPAETAELQRLAAR